MIDHGGEPDASVGRQEGDGDGRDDGDDLRGGGRLRTVAVIGVVAVTPTARHSFGNTAAFIKIKYWIRYFLVLRLPTHFWPLGAASYALYSSGATRTYRVGVASHSQLAWHKDSHESPEYTVDYISVLQMSLNLNVPHCQ